MTHTFPGNSVSLHPDTDMFRDTRHFWKRVFDFQAKTQDPSTSG